MAFASLGRHDDQLEPEQYSYSSRVNPFPMMPSFTIPLVGNSSTRLASDDFLGSKFMVLDLAKF